MAPNEQGTNSACTACEVDQCPPITPCSTFGTQASVCNAVLDCVRRTSCHSQSPNDCLCGSGAVDACENGDPAGLLGPCVNEIRAGLPGVPDNQLLNSLFDQTFPTGAAMFLSLCDSAICTTQCVPYCGGPI
jgi:hypothetical protein